MHSTLNGLCPYYTMFPLDFPLRVLAKASAGEWVLDPFCGRGTTNYAARLCGLSSVGIDSNPVATAIASAKLASSTADDVVALCNDIVKNRRMPSHIPVGEFWQRCFHARTLVSLSKLREYFLLSCTTDTEIVLRAVAMGVLHGPKLKTVTAYASNQMPRTYATKPDAAVRFWKRHRLKPQPIDIVDVVRRKAERALANVPPAVKGKIITADSRHINRYLRSRRFSWVITSPPYYQMQSYMADQWLRNWFIGGAPDVTYRSDGQLSHAGAEGFSSELSTVWTRVARLCLPDAHMVIRFGALPSRALNATELIKDSIRSANCGWRILTVRDAGVAPSHKRQASQFQINSGRSVAEADIYAILEA